MKYFVDEIEKSFKSGAKNKRQAILMAGYPVNGYTQKLGSIAQSNFMKNRYIQKSLSDYTRAAILNAINVETKDNVVNVSRVLKRLRLNLGGDNHKSVAMIVDELGIKRKKNGYSMRAGKRKNQPVVAEPAVAEPAVVCLEEPAASSDGFAIWQAYLNAKNEFDAAKARYDAARARVFDLLGIQYGE